MAACEHVMDHLALACKVPQDELRRSNMYQSGQATHFGMILDQTDGGKWNVPSMWDRLEKEIGIAKFREEAGKFNARNKWVKRGVSFLPTKFGIAFTAKYTFSLFRGSSARKSPITFTGSAVTSPVV